MKKTIALVLASVMILALFAGCASTSPSPSASPSESQASSQSPSASLEPTPTPDIVDGKFTTTRSITVEVFDRANDGGSKPDDNFYTNFIKEGMLRDHNVDVTFVSVPRWTEVEAMNNLLAANTAPDVCVTYSYPTIQTYANMGGIVDIAPHLEQNKDALPNLFSFLGDTNIYYDQDPEVGTLWAIEAKLFHITRINTFVREDWLKKLNLAEPTSLQEFEAMLVAFKDNAEMLLGKEAKQMIPFALGSDVGWRADHLTAAFVPDAFTDKDAFIYGFDDRHFLKPGIKNGIQVLNDWYNKGLIWKDFALYPAGDATEDNLIKSGFVGSFIHNWDYPYRNGDDGIHNTLKRLVGEDAAFIAIEPFKNDAGVNRKFLSGPVDRKVFFPGTNDEPVASLMYLDWLCKLENRSFLQIGEEGVTHETQADGSVKTIAATGEKIMNSPLNIDYTIVINGLDLGETEKNIKSLAYSYAGVDSRFIDKAYQATLHDGRVFQKYNVGEIKAEDGMATPLKEKRDAILTQSVVSKPDKFDSVFDSGMTDYLSSGGQAIIDERAAAFAKYYEK